MQKSSDAAPGGLQDAVGSEGGDGVWIDLVVVQQIQLVVQHADAGG